MDEKTTRSETVRVDGEDLAVLYARAPETKRKLDSLINELKHLRETTKDALLCATLDGLIRTHSWRQG